MELTKNIGTEDEWAIPSTIKAHVSHVNSTHHWPCGICAGETDKTDILVSFYMDGDEYFICEECIATGSDAINDRLRQTVENLEYVAKRFREIVDAEPVWDIPSRLNVQRCQEAYEAEMALLKQSLATSDDGPDGHTIPF